MAEVVLIHGMAQEGRRDAEELESEWVPALAAGVRTVGYPALADRLWRDGPVPGGIETRMVFYGDLFLGKDFQGANDDLEGLDPDQEALAVALAREWLTRAAQRDGHPDQRDARTELAYLEPGHEEQGVKEEAARAVLNGVAHLSWFAHPGMAFAQRFVNKSLRQVTAYLTDPKVRAEVQARVAAQLGPDTRVIVGHSLGSVVAYEAAAQLSRPLPLLVTIGSPLGLRTVIYDRLIPQPPTFPARVARWVNVADRDDLVAARPDLTNLFTAGKPDGAVLESTATVDNGAQPHSAVFYLPQREVAGPIADALTTP